MNLKRVIKFTGTPQELRDAIIAEIDRMSAAARGPSKAVAIERATLAHVRAFIADIEPS